MSNWILKVENLGKRYTIRSAKTERYTALRDVIARKARSFFNRTDAEKPPADSEHFWALEGVSFEVKRGEIMGVVGRNGAGKSTLLKLLSRITEPTRGRIHVRGKVASLLEVGTGFHPELTGRENIFLNGAILGMSRAEIRSKFDEIVQFAEVEQFVDTPVKRYSSGMYVRLAFAVAAHLEPDILIIDEVLAVGDAAFQRRCLGKIDAVSRSGRTVLFVSHQMASVQALCSSAILLSHGKLLKHGPTQSIIRDYLTLSNGKAAQSVEFRDRATDLSSTLLTSLSIEDADGKAEIFTSSRLKITIGYSGANRLSDYNLLIAIYDLGNAGIYAFRTSTSKSLPDNLPPSGTLVCITDRINITPGRCYINIALQKCGANLDHIPHAAEFDVEPDPEVDPGSIPSRDWVLVALNHSWSFEPAP